MIRRDPMLRLRPWVGRPATVRECPQDVASPTLPTAGLQASYVGAWPAVGWPALGWALLVWGAAVGWATARERPHVLLVVVDDLAPDSLAAYGNFVCRTPCLDRIAREGIRLDDAHHMGSWSGAVCLPSRTMLMTGRTLWRLPNAPRRHGQLEAVENPAAFVARSSLPAAFRAAGYDAFLTCKASNTFEPANALFTTRHEADKRGADPADGSAWHADRAVEFLRARAESGDPDPFLLFLGFSHPHDPRHASAARLARYGAVDAAQPPPAAHPAAPPLPVNYLPFHPFPHGHPDVRDEVQVEGVLADRSPATVRNEIGREYACMEEIDRQIGRVLAELESTGLLDATYVLFTSDHGIALGRHGLMGKQNLYEHSWRVPLLVRGPGIRPGSSASGYAYLLDLAPTLCELAGVAAPPEMEGISLAPVLRGESPRVRDVLYGVYCGGAKPGVRSVKSDGWKLIKYDVREGRPGTTQLFDLRTNPQELLREHHDPAVVAATGNRPAAEQRNLADDPRHAARRRVLEGALLAEQIRHDDPYRLWDQPGR